FRMFPDLRYSNMHFENPRRISFANPQQDNYKWGNIELYNWTSIDGQQLQGLLVKPDDFDPNKQYPMIVNFYERSTNGLHQHRAPYPHRSTINYSFYTSRGYVIFNPDVPYRVGYPGESAYNAVVSGTSALLDEGFVDRERVALQGHSWGGYQIAHIVTKTDLFRCAESGAPVVNMISAYGGIRWGSGMSRMFQYEHTQSRLGGTLWEKPMRYVENSPIFWVDKINTPLLILHNDEDGAVPWYQGIEFFVALRRLGKPAWLLNYNGEPHWPVKLQNRKDFNIRMQQFFDHYLMDAAKPLWMERGVPAIEKGIEQGLELMEKE
ncbi:MAG: prolyl oligopeptidase family serine peptidase, partial [Bacteroidota bacterium]